MSINICKECGKQFEAKSPRILYCPAVHYRPCPVCGEPVIAKYLSDPPRRCDKCKGKSIPAQSKVEPAKVESVGAVNHIAAREYQGPKILGFIPGHKYIFDAPWDGWSAYVVNATYDATDDKVVDLTMHLSSKVGIDRYFKK